MPGTRTKQNLHPRKRKKKSIGKSELPRPFVPMLASLTDGPFDDENFLFEQKWDGYRSIAMIQQNKVELYSRNLKSFTHSYPSIAKALEDIDETMILDGEIVAENKQGISDFQLLQNSNNDEKINLRYYVFDLLHLNGHDLFNMPLTDRKELLKMFFKNNKTLKQVFYSDHIIKNGIAFFESAKKKGLEGIIAKEKNSLYYPGQRTGNWLKIKITYQQELLIIGMTEPKGSRDYFGSLLLGYYQKGQLKYAGNCGTGFTFTTLEMLFNKSKKYFTSEKQVKEKIPSPDKIQWIKPKLICQVKFTEWTRSGILRHPVYLGLRNDKDPATITREHPAFHHEKNKQQGSKKSR